MGRTWVRQPSQGHYEELSDVQFVRGFGSIGGEEFFSYQNISDGLHRLGGEELTRQRFNQ
jgi:hypothetical protein